MIMIFFSKFYALINVLSVYGIHIFSSTSLMNGTRVSRITDYDYMTSSDCFFTVQNIFVWKRITSVTVGL